MPAGGETLRAQFIEVDAPERSRLNAAVFLPPGEGPFPVVMVLHGTGGWVLRSAALGEVFARAGFLTVSGAWFSGSGEKSPTAPTPIASPGGPAFHGANLNSIKYIKALMGVARVLPGANEKQVGLIGTSRGASAALLVASTDGIQAVVSDSGAYTNMVPGLDTPPVTVVGSLSAPVLILHGTADRTVPLQQALDYERALRESNKPYEAHYYEGGPHGLTVWPATRADAQDRAIRFFKKHLGSARASSSGR